MTSYFKEVKEELANTDAAHDAAVAKAVKNRFDKEVEANGVINLLEESTTEESTTKAKKTSANLSTSMAYSKTSLKSSLKSSLAQPTLSTELMRALESPSSHSITFDDNVRSASLEKLLADCDQKHVYVAVHDKMKKTLPITVDDIDVYFSTSPGTSDDMARFKNDFDKLCALIDVHVQQVLCMYDMSKQTLSKFGDALSDDALCEVFASYLLDTIVALKRASLVLDNGRAIVKKDSQSNHLCIDLILQKERHWELKKRYPTIDAKRLKIGKIGNLMATCYDAIHEGLHSSMDFMMQYFMKKFTFTKQGHIMQATYLKSDLKLKCLQKAIYSLSSVDYSSSTMSSYPRIQYQFNLSIEGKAVVAQRRQNRKRIVESDEESDQDEDVLSLKKAASLKKTVDDTLTDDKHAELIAAKKSDGLREWMGRQQVDWDEKKAKAPLAEQVDQKKAQKAKVEVASAKEVEKKVEAVLGKAKKNPKAPSADQVDQKKAQAGVEASSAKEVDQRKKKEAKKKAKAPSADQVDQKKEPKQVSKQPKRAVREKTEALSAEQVDQKKAQAGVEASSAEQVDQKKAHAGVEASSAKEVDQRKKKEAKKKEPKQVSKQPKRAVREKAEALSAEQVDQKKAQAGVEASSAKE
eukprot:scaffold25028_cov127-Skeletonema_marinoi.AAC.1